MFQQIPCGFCGSTIMLNEDNRLTDIRQAPENPDTIGWCSNCGTFYTRKVNNPLAAYWVTPAYAKKYVSQVS